MELNYSCPHCKKKLVEGNKKTPDSSGLIIKSRLVFLNDNGQVLCKCVQCHNVVGLPLNFLTDSAAITES